MRSRRLPLGVTVVLFVLLYGLFFFAQKQPADSPLRSILPVVSVSPSPAPSILPAVTTAAGFVPVTKVVDGDTIKVLLDGKTETVRLIGINTPETVDPRKTVECFGKEASAHAKQILTNASVKLVSDPTQDNRDRYKRLLRYVYLSDGSLFNLRMIQEGYAYEYTYDIPYQFQQEFKQAQDEAAQAERGLWSQKTCNGKL